MRVLVTGGAGYIGAHTVRELINAGHSVTVLDNLSRGNADAVDPRATFVLGNISNLELLTRCLISHKIEMVIHFAGFADASESLHEPFKYYLTNFSFTLVLLEAMIKTGVKKIIYSSSAAVFGHTHHTPITEKQIPHPITPYGRSKLMAEEAIADFSRAYGLGFTILRYFNVAGASPDLSMGEAHQPEHHLIPRILQAVKNGGEVEVLGTNFHTPDGTCIRDYLHVIDVARAHLLCMENMEPGKGEIYHLGSEHGFSLNEVIHACEAVTGMRINVKESLKRPHEPDILILSSQKIRNRLRWMPLYPSIQTIIHHSWKWHSTHPHGYSSSEPPVQNSNL